MKDRNQVSGYVKAIVIIFSFSIVFLICMGVFVLQTRRELTQSSEQRYDSHLIADDLYQSSEDLTRFVRLYVATGDSYYKDIFFDVLDIRNGEIARPYQYNGLYWDLKIPDRERATEDGIKLSLNERMMKAGLTSNEIDLLYQSENESNKLVETELMAMRAIENTLTENDKLLMLPNETNQEFAIRILNDQTYMETKERIMEPISRFYETFEARADKAASDSSTKATVLIGILGAYIFAIIFILLFLIRKVLKLFRQNEALLEDRIRNRTKELLKFSMGIEQSPAAIFLTDATGTIEYVNPQFTKTTGYSKEEAIGQNSRILKSGLTPESVYKDLWATILSGKEWAGEFCNKKKSGELFWERAHISPVKDENGEITNIIAIKEDITEQRLLNEQLKSSEEKFRIIADYSYDWEAWFSPEGRLLWTSPACLKLTGYTVAECMESDNFPFILFLEEDLPEITELFQQAIGGSTENNKIFRIRKKNGEVFWSAISWNPVYDSDGNFFGTRTSLRDISDRIQVEDDLKLALNKVEALYETSLSLRNTMDVGKVLEIILGKLKEVVPFYSASIQEYKDNHFTVLHCMGHKNCKDIIGTSFFAREGSIGGEICKSKKPLIIPDIKEYSDYVDLTDGKLIRSLLGVPLVLNDEIVGVLTLDSKENDYFTQEMAIVAMAFASQAAIALNNSNNMKELIKAKEEAETATKVKGDFLANMSHEIRTPMNAVIGLNSLLARTDLKADQRDYVDKIGMSAQSLLKIINDILDFSKIESGKLRIENINFSLDDVLDNLSNIVSLRAYNKGVEFVIIKDKNIPNYFIGDPFRIGQVLLNIVNNAIKFTDEGEVIVKITAKKAESDRIILEFSVEDTGIGMTQEQVSYLFQAFTQADISTTRKYGGTGLGLSISKDLVSLMGGTIHAESEYGRGSKFTFTISVAKSNKKGKKEIAIPAYISSLKVLLVEDNAYSREVLKTYLEDFHFTPDSVASGEEAIARAEKTDYDLIIIDYRMPGLNGVETWRQIRKTRAEEDRPICLLVSAFVDENVIHDALDEGMRKVLYKPISQSVLFDTLVELFIKVQLVSKNDQTNNKHPKGFDGIAGAQILLVEDNEINQQVAKEILELEGFWVDIARNGKIAIEKATNKHYDLVLMDLQMPVLDGYEATNVLRKKYKMDNLPIIALSADAMSGTESSARAAGMNDYLTKPINSDELFQKMVKWIQPMERSKNIVQKHSASKFREEALVRHLKNIDVKKGLKYASDNVELYLSILSRFYYSNQEFDKEISQLIKENDMPGLIRIIHTLKGVSGNIGAKVLNYLIKALEEAIKGGATAEGIKINIDQVIHEMNIVFGQIRSLLDTIEAQSEDKAVKQMTREQLVANLRKLKSLLENYDAEATALYDEILPHLKNKNRQADFEKLGKLINNYDFEEALQICSRILDKIAN